MKCQLSQGCLIPFWLALGKLAAQWVTKLRQQWGLGSGEKREKREEGHSETWPDQRRQAADRSMLPGVWEHLKDRSSHKWLCKTFFRINFTKIYLQIIKCTHFKCVVWWVGGYLWYTQVSTTTINIQNPYTIARNPSLLCNQSPTPPPGNHQWAFCHYSLSSVHSRISYK